MEDKAEHITEDRTEFDLGTLIWLLGMAAAMAFFVYMTISYGSALNVPLNL